MNTMFNQITLTQFLSNTLLDTLCNCGVRQDKPFIHSSFIFPKTYLESKGHPRVELTNIGAYVQYLNIMLLLYTDDAIFKEKSVIFRRIFFKWLC